MSRDGAPKEAHDLLDAWARERVTGKLVYHATSGEYRRVEVSAEVDLHAARVGFDAWTSPCCSAPLRPRAGAVTADCTDCGAIWSWHEVHALARQTGANTK